MKSFFKIMGVLLIIAVMFGSCGKAESGGSTRSGEVSKAKTGLYVDKVIFGVGMDQSVCLKEVVEGKMDVLFTAVPNVLIEGLSDEDRDKLDTYTVPSGSLALWLNPIPNKAPYVFNTTQGEEVFNPLAIREVRYAMNWLIDRKKIVDEILHGGGDPMITPIGPGMPGTYLYNLVPAKLGMSATGDKDKGLKMIDEALKKAAELPENKGKLVKGGKFWEYKGSPIYVKFYIRVDDPNGRLLIGRYVSDLLEEAGIKVERLEWDRSKTGSAVYGANPQDYICSMYTEGWGAGGTNRWWDINFSQMGAPFYGNMPGGANEEYWNYANEEIDRLGQKGLYGQILTEDDYYKSNIRLCELIMHDSIRIWLSTQNDIYVANKERFNSRFVYGLGNGLNEFSVITADVKPEEDGPDKGKKVLRVLQFSAKGSLFMSAWDPVSTGGFTDTYSNNIVGILTNRAQVSSPVNAVPVKLISDWTSDPKMAPKLVKDENGDEVMSGDIPVPANAVMYDSKTKTWVEVGEGKTCAVEASGSLFPNYYWHNGIKIDNSDVRYAIAFQHEWCTKDGDDDPYYLAPLATQLSSALKNRQGFVFRNDGSVVTYTNFYFPGDPKVENASSGAVTGKAGNPGRPTMVPWDITDAICEICVTSSASGTKYTLEEGDPNQVDVLVSGCVADIKAKLQEFIDTDYVPVCLKGLIKVEDAKKRYKASIDFIDKYGHAYISSGPAVLTKIDTTSKSIILEPWEKFPKKAHEFVKQFTTMITSVDYIKAPGNAKVGDDAKFEITVTEYLYPNDETNACADAKVVLKLQLPDGSEKTYDGSYESNGKYIVTIPGSDTGSLKAGAYTAVVISSIADEAPSVSTSSLILH